MTIFSSVAVAVVVAFYIIRSFLIHKQQNEQNEREREKKSVYKKKNEKSRVAKSHFQTMFTAQRTRTQQQHNTTTVAATTKL